MVVGENWVLTLRFDRGLTTKRWFSWLSIVKKVISMIIIFHNVEGDYRRL